VESHLPSSPSHAPLPSWVVFLTRGLVRPARLFVAMPSVFVLLSQQVAFLRPFPFKEEVRGSNPLRATEGRQHCVLTACALRSGHFPVLRAASLQAAFLSWLHGAR